MGRETAVMHMRQGWDDHWLWDGRNVSIWKLFEARGDAVIAAAIAVCRWRLAAGVARLVVEDQVWFLLGIREFGFWLGVGDECRDGGGFADGSFALSASESIRAEA